MTTLTAKDPVTEAQKWAKEAKDQATAAKEAAAKLDCERPRSSDKRKLVKAVNAARAAAENAQAWADQAKADAEKATSVADAHPNNEKAQEAKDAAEKIAEDTQKAADEAKAAYEKALEEAPGMKAAADLEKELDKADTKGNSKKGDIVERLKKTAKDAAENDPCDPEKVKSAVRAELGEIKKDVARNGEMKPWVDELADTLKGKELIYYQAPGTDEMVITTSPRAKLLLGVQGQLQQSPITPARLFGGDQYGDLEGSVYSDPAMFKNLFETLGGEFWLGSFSNPGTFSPPATTAQRSLGLQVMVPVGRFAAVGASVAQGKFTVSSTFPAMVVNPLNGETRQFEGRSSLDVKTQQLELSGRAYLFSPGTVQLFAGAAAQYVQQTSSMPTAELEDQTWTYGSETKSNFFGLSGQAGISLQPSGWPVFVELGAAVQKTLRGNSPKPSLVLQATVGWKW